ncbi:MAG: copper resistance system multicopper oxidase [Lysobacterales bacterium]
MNAPFDPARRRFVTSTLAIAGAAALPRGLFAQGTNATRIVPELRGTDFVLDVGALPVNLSGRRAWAKTVNGSLPAPTLRWREGDTVALRVNNSLHEMTSLHWHGILLPADMDGVPGLSFHGIAPGASYLYRFPVQQAGTYWYHAHSSLQEAQGVYGAIVIDPREPDGIAADREHVVLLSDWSDEDPHAIQRKLLIESDIYNRHRRTVGDLLRDAKRDGWPATRADRAMWGRMRMSPTDLADVGAPTYTYLANGHAPDANWTAVFARGERVRLRFVNGSAMTYFDVRIPGLKMTVVAADGQRVHPVTVDEFRIAVAETLDVVVEPQDQAYTIFAQAMDRGGYARATLAPRDGMSAPVPPLDPRPLLTMADMGMEHGAGHDMAKMDHAMPGMHHGAANMPGKAPDEAGSKPLPDSPWIDMRATSVSKAQDDPGVGLRGNGRRVLTLADLRSDFADPDGREPGRTLELHLTGNMERYAWGFDGVPYSQSQPIRFDYGERLRIVLVNDTMMEHPIHLHGMWSDIEDEDGAFRVRRHTVTVPPGHSRSYRVRADALGRWAYHCHMLLHMELGMFREVRVDA